MKRILFAAVLAAAVFVGVVIVRTARFPSRQMQVSPAPSIDLPMEAASRRLSTAIQIKTLSQSNPDEETGKALLRLREFFGRAFPGVHTHLEREVINGHSLLYTWKGKNPSLAPMLVAGHMDVVPVDPSDERNWTHPPFAGRIADDYIWGRGAMDDKVGVLGVLEAVEYLINRGFHPLRTLYLAFGHDEESGGRQGAAKIAAVLRERSVQLELVLDEGGNITDQIIPGIDRPVALVGIAEKGYLSLKLEAKTAGGHSSMPPAHTAIGTLGGAIHKLELAPMTSRLTAPTKLMFAFIGPEMAWHRRIVFANLWLFDKVVRTELDKTPSTRAVVRTTLAPTIFHSGVRENVLPTQANAVVNLRVLPGDTIAAVTNHVRKTIDDARIIITPGANEIEPSPVADVDSSSFKIIQRTIHQIVPDAVVAPFLLVATTDARHYTDLTENIYRFLSITLRPEDTTRYHGVNERISIQDYERCIKFYIQLIRNVSED